MSSSADQPGNMVSFITRRLDQAKTEPAPDRSTVRPLIRVAGASIAHFTLAAGHISQPIRHRTVEEVWYVLSGSGTLWRREPAGEGIEALRPGTCVTIPPGTSFQFRSTATESLCILGVTLPPWPGPDEAEACNGIWPADGQ
ncbi:MAG: cupin domain-containing protein [Gammaproteobacteria bacterium]